MAILYVAAEARELKPFAATLSNGRSLKWPVDYAAEGILEGRRVLLAANGMGSPLSSQAVEVAVRAITAADLSASRLEAVVSTGFCGALSPDLREGDVVVATEVLDAASGTMWECLVPPGLSAAASGRIVTQNRIARTSDEKKALGAGGAIAVEMEAAGVAARAQRSGLPFVCIKVVSDRVDESFGLDLDNLRDREGRVSRGKIVSHAVTHPWLLPELFRLKQRADFTAKALGEFLVSCRISIGQNPAEREVVTS